MVGRGTDSWFTRISRFVVLPSEEYGPQNLFPRARYALVGLCTLKQIACLEKATEKAIRTDARHWTNRLSSYLSGCLSVCQFVCLSVRLFVPAVLVTACVRSIVRSVGISISLSIYVSVSLSVLLRLSVSPASSMPDLLSDSIGQLRYNDNRGCSHSPLPP